MGKNTPTKEGNNTERLPIRSINVMGEVYLSKYDPESGTIYFLDEEGNPTGRTEQVNPGIAPIKNSPDENQTQTGFSFHPLAFFSGVSVTALLTAGYILIQYCRYVGML